MRVRGYLQVPRYRIDRRIVPQIEKHHLLPRPQPELHHDIAPRRDEIKLRPQIPALSGRCRSLGSQRRALVFFSSAAAIQAGGRSMSGSRLALVASAQLIPSGL